MLVDGELFRLALGFLLMKFGKLLMQTAHCGVDRFIGHLAALRRAFHMELAILARGHVLPLR